MTILAEDPIRDNPSDIEEAPWLLQAPQASILRPEPEDDAPPAQLAPIVTGCAWLRHCRDDAAMLPEPERRREANASLDERPRKGPCSVWH